MLKSWRQPVDYFKQPAWVLSTPPTSLPSVDERSDRPDADDTPEPGGWPVGKAPPRIEPRPAEAAAAHTLSL